MRGEWRSDSKMKCVGIGITYNKRLTKLLKCWSVRGGLSTKLMDKSKNTSEKTFPTNVLWVKNDLRKELSMRNYLVMFNVILKSLRTCAATFPTFFPSSKVLMWVGIILIIWWNSTQKKEDIMVEPKTMLISSFIPTNGTIKTPLLLFFLKLGLICNKIQRFVQCTPRKRFNNFLQSAVDARRQEMKIQNRVLLPRLWNY